MIDESLLLRRLEEGLSFVVPCESDCRLVALSVRETIARAANRTMAYGGRSEVVSVRMVTIAAGDGNAKVIFEVDHDTYISDPDVTVGDLRRVLVPPFEYISLHEDQILFTGAGGKLRFSWCAKCAIDSTLVVNLLRAAKQPEPESEAEQIDDRLRDQRHEFEQRLAEEERERRQTAMRDFVAKRTRSSTTTSKSARVTVNPVPRITVRSKQAKERERVTKRGGGGGGTTASPMTQRFVEKRVRTERQQTSMVRAVLNWILGIGGGQQQSAQQSSYAETYSDDEELFVY